MFEWCNHLGQYLPPIRPSLALLYPTQQSSEGDYCGLMLKMIEEKSYMLCDNEASLTSETFQNENLIQN